jgi:hypothetical protein
MSKCPKCEKNLPSIKMDSLPGNLGFSSWDCITYSCPFCFTVLSVGIDPVILKTDTIDGVIEALKNQ